MSPYRGTVLVTGLETVASGPPATGGARSRRLTVDIDIGGTLTDGLFSDGATYWTAKVDTTPHDFTVCFFTCLEEGARLGGFEDLTGLLDQVAVIRWSATIATNVLAERKGPRIGLVVDPEQEAALYGAGPSPAVGHVVDTASIATVAPGAREEELLAVLRALLERGARRLCVSFGGAFEDAGRELEVKRLVEEQFPDHYLGSVPLVLGSEICRHPDDRTRTHIALVNAYVHTPLASALFRAEDELLSRYRYRRPLYIGHVNGGVARVAKTRGVDTIESGPVFGLAGAAHLARAYGLGRVLALDIGGTTAKIGLVIEGEPVRSSETDFFGIDARIPWLLLRSVALGGGSVARVVDGELTLGPDSMGAFPGPACYDLGGENATLTDALLVAGRLDPERFLGGRKTLSAGRAAETLAEHVAAPLGVPVAEAAERVLAAAVELVAAAVERTLAEADESPDGLALFAFGGNGANFAASVAGRLGVRAASAFVLGPVLSAYGSSVSDLCHVEELWPHLRIDADTGPRVGALVEAGRERVVAELEGEGFARDAIVLQAELTLGGGSLTEWRGPAEAAAVAAALASAAGRSVERIAVRGSCAMPSPELRREPGGAPTRPQPASLRELGAGGSLPVFDWDALAPGALIEGPGLLESDTNTCMVPAGWSLVIDELRNARIEPAGGGS
ncbi:MAG: hydantoinase/oxoprolinase family protein [Thermoleophilia bacterium]|nr:hydantoinase/oxoprolinase family protein [Thermoleophilia bacterium]